MAYLAESRLLINGKWIDPEGDRWSEVRNPATGEVIGRAACATAAQVDQAVAAARAAFPGWAALPARERGRLLERVREKVAERQEEIARLITLENGKPLKDARGEVGWTMELLRFYAAEAERVAGTVPPAYQANRRSLVIWQPVGVVAAITPWNFPVDLMSWKLAPALAAGCTVVAKPAPNTPLAAALFAECFRAAGIPPGVVNFVTGGVEVGQALVRHPQVDKVSFTGSTQVGKQIMASAAEHLAKVTLELGGHAPVIICDDADLDKAIPYTLRRSFSHAGQICHSINHILVHKAIAEEYIERFVAAARRLRVGDGLQVPDADLGPMATPEVLQKVEEHVRDALEKGATLLLGGHRLTEPPYDRGLFYAPTVLTGITPEMRIAREETFGPVAPITVVRDDEEALALANSTAYGLVAYLFTRSLDRAFRLAERLEAGTVGVNNCATVQLNAPYGGWKQSGLGVELGPEGIREYLRLKHVAIELDR
ncbi:MAG: NAD-dependent succinate-semialdehyde dehydrogenase [Bacillota bacterium]